jgi:hypothetical protein
MQDATLRLTLHIKSVLCRKQGGRLKVVTAKAGNMPRPLLRASIQSGSYTSLPPPAMTFPLSRLVQWHGARLRGIAAEA